jgi:hypothetical protein
MPRPLVRGRLIGTVRWRFYVPPEGVCPIGFRNLDSPDDVARTLSAVRRLQEHADDLRIVLRAGDPEDQRRISTRTIRSVTWMREEDRLELRLTLSQPESEEGRVETVRARGGIRTHTPRGAAPFKDAVSHRSTTRAP